ncbi:MAG: DUF4870 domain-containing protein [Porphyromonadaceae bacterium]|nr:DUF4870 domain-containing protein [Porphyromonadaceae bacterium]
MPNKYTELEKLRELYSKGEITEEEFNLEKEKILKGEMTGDNKNFHKRVQNSDNRTFNSLMHISQLSNFLFPFLGIIIPIVMWSTRKEEDKSVDRNGKIILNWNISVFIYMSILVFILILMILGLGGLAIFSGMNLDSTAFGGFDVDSPAFVLKILGTFAIVIIPMIIFGLLDFIFTIVGAIKAGNGEIWNYPLSIRFFKTK